MELGSVGYIHLVLQPHLCPELSALDVRLFGPCLVTAPPRGPLQDLVDGWRRLPDEREEQPAHLRHAEWQQVEQLSRRHPIVRSTGFFLLACPLCCAC